MDNITVDGHGAAHKGKGFATGGGEYTAARKDQAAGSLTRVNRLSKMTPVAVDTELAGHHSVLAPVRAQMWKQVDFISEAKQYKWVMENHPGSQRYRYDRWKFENVDEKLAKAEAARDELQQQIDEYTEEHITPLNDEWERRGRWSRFFLVTSSSGGHVHSSMRCSTCGDRTKFIWLVEESGKSEEEIVERAGDGACTVCYPTAPIRDRANPRPNPFEDPEVKATREAAAQIKAEKDAVKQAKAISAPDGSPIRDDTGRVIPTEVGAERYVLDEMDRIGWYKKPEDYVARELEAIADIQIALAVKRGVPVSEIRESWEKKLAAKVKRDKMDPEQAAFMNRAVAKVNAIVDSRDNLA